MQTTAAYVGRRRAYRANINTGTARLPRVKLPKGKSGEVRKVPQSRTGRAAHPPRVEHVLKETINDKERRKAIRSALAATALREFVEKRGHRVAKLKSLPLVIENDFENITKTKEVLKILAKLGLGEEMQRAQKITMRAGKGKARGRPYRVKKSVLIVISKNAPIVKAARNLTGFDIVSYKQLNADVLAPGGVPGRLTLFSENALNETSKYFA